VLQTGNQGTFSGQQHLVLVAVAKESVPNIHTQGKELPEPAGFGREGK